jgi:hypothetical protein
MNYSSFFDRNEIESALLMCPCCKSRFEQPIFLPCQDSICLKCLDTLAETSARSGYIQCPECKLDHPVQNKTQYKPNRFIEKALKIEPIKVTRGSQFEKCLQSTNQKINDLVETIQNSETLVGESETKISEFFSKLKNQIDLSVEVKIEQLNKYRDEYIQRISDYEQECINNLNKNLKVSFVENGSSLKKAEAWSELVKKPNCSEESIQDIRVKAQDMKIDLDAKIRSFEHKLFCQKVFEFKANNSEFKKEDIGVLVEKGPLFDVKTNNLGSVFQFGSQTPPAINFSGDMFAKEKAEFKAKWSKRINK